MMQEGCPGKFATFFLFLCTGVVFLEDGGSESFPSHVKYKLRMSKDSIPESHLLKPK